MTDNKAFRESLDKKVSGMRSQTMTFANEGMEVALSIPDTSDVKEVFGTVIDTVTEQHDELGKLNNNLDEVAVENRKARKKLQDATSDKLQQLLAFQLKLDEQIQLAQRNIRNFAYNIQGYVDENDEVVPSIASGTEAKVIKDIVLTVEDEQQQPTLFPTEEGAAPQSDVSMQAAPPKKKKRPNLSGIDYHSVPPFTLPVDVKARWRWAIKKTLQSIRRKKMKIGYTRTRVEKSQTLVARLDTIDQELCKIPGMVSGKIKEAVDKVMEEVGAELQSIKNDLNTHIENTAKEAEETNRKFEDLYTIVRGMEEKSNGKIKELEDKVDLLHQEHSDKIADLAKQIKDMFDLSLDQLKNSLKTINDNLTLLDQQAAKLLADIQTAAVSINNAPEDKSERLRSFMHDNSILQEYQSQIGVVEGAADMMQRTVRGLSSEINGALHHYGQQFNHVVSESDLSELKDLLNKSKGADIHIKGIRDNLESMKKIMNLHHKLLKEATEDIVDHSLQFLNAVPNLETGLVQLKDRHDAMYSSFEAAEAEKKEMQENLESLQNKLDELETKQGEQMTLLEEYKNKPPTVITAPAPIITSNSDSRPSHSDSRPTHSAGRHRRPSSARPPSRPLSSSRREVYDDSPRESEAGEVVSSRNGTPTNRQSSAGGNHRTVTSAPQHRSSGTYAKDLASIKSQLDSLKEMILNTMMKSQMPKLTGGKPKKEKPTSAKKSKPAVEPAPVPATTFNDSAPATATEPATEDVSEPATAEEVPQDVAPKEVEIQQQEKVEPEVAAQEEDAEEEDDEEEENAFSLEDMLKTLFPDEKLEKKVEEILDRKLPAVMKNLPPQTYVPPPSYAPQQAHDADNRGGNNGPAQGYTGVKYTSNIKESIRKAIQQADEISGPIQTREGPISPQRNSSVASSDSMLNNRVLIGSFVDYNAQNFVRNGGPETLPANFDSTPFIADIATLRSENMIMGRKIEQILDNFIDAGAVKQICQDLFREQRKKESKTDYKAMVEDMDQTVRELVHELLNVKRNNEANLAKLREELEAALGQALLHSSQEFEENADGVATTKSLCLGCGRMSSVRNTAASRPTSPSFLPALNAHVQPGPDIYRGGFRIPVRTSSPPPGHHTEIPLVMRSRVMTAPEAKHGIKPVSQESLIAPSVTTLKIPSLNPTASTVEDPSSKGEGLQVGFEEGDDLAMPSISLHQIEPVNYGFEQESSRELPRLKSANGVVRSAPNREEAESQRPIFRKGFPAKKSLRAEMSYAPERFDMTVGAYPVAKSNHKQLNNKPILSSSLTSLNHQ